MRFVSIDHGNVEKRRANLDDIRGQRNDNHIHVYVIYFRMQLKFTGCEVSSFGAPGETLEAKPSS
jgi:hypothetical protein